MIALPNLDQFTLHIQQLPRELRDLIWAYTVKQDGPVAITESVIPIDIADIGIRDELEEAACIYNTLIVTLPHPDTILDDTTRPTIWGTRPQCKRHIRKLIIEVVEATLYDSHPRVLMRKDHPHLLTREHERTVSRSWSRKQWADLLEMPRLETLTINMQKPANTDITWTVFSPILIQLRKSKPNVCITFNISYDNMLERIWNMGAWADVGDEDYEPMGFADVSELVGLPTHEDRAYMGDNGFDISEISYSSIRSMPNRLVIQGLLPQSAPDRRRLAPHYLVREPQVLKVLIGEHYEVYRMVKKENEEAAATGEM
jgi:hypothetical protein